MNLGDEICEFDLDQFLLFCEKIKVLGKDGSLKPFKSQLSVYFLEKMLSELRVKQHGSGK
jgi:hypothetical protein